MTTFESCDRPNGGWFQWSCTLRKLQMWVHRTSDNPQFQSLDIMLSSDMEVCCLKTALESLNIHSASPLPMTCPDVSKKTCYVTDHDSNGTWVTVENDHLVMSVRRNNDLGKKSELRISIRNANDLKQLKQAVSGQ